MLVPEYEWTSENLQEFLFHFHRKLHGSSNAESQWLKKFSESIEAFFLLSILFRKNKYPNSVCDICTLGDLQLCEKHFPVF